MRANLSLMGERQVWGDTGSLDGAEATLLGLVEAAVLTHLEEHGTATLRGLIQALERPPPL